MQIDPKGLEAAIEAAHDAWTNGCEHEADDLGLRHAVPAAIRAYLSALSPAGTASEMEPVGWMPIETAPKDGTRVDLWQKGRFTEAFWDEGEEWWCIDSRYSDGEPCPLAVSPEPTHWMPLPAPPKAGE